MDERYSPAGPRHQLERLVFFSDAVFAIAITLLVIDLHAPHLPYRASTSAFAQALLDLSPELAGFLISFFVIGAFWGGHHRCFALAHGWDDRLTFRNLLLLLAIVAMPFFTAFMSANPGGRLPAVLYCLWLLVAGLLNLRLQRVVTSPPVAGLHVAPERVAEIRRRGRAVALGAASAVIATALLPIASFGMLALMTIPLWRMALTRFAKRQPDS